MDCLKYKYKEFYFIYRTERYAEGIQAFFIFWLDPKNEAKKGQDCARFARKISARAAKPSKTRPEMIFN